MNGDSPLSRDAIRPSGSGSPSSTSVRRKRSMLALLPRLARHEILGDEPRFGRLAGLDVGVGQLRLRAVHRRLEAAVDADLDQPHQRRDVVRHAGDELLQHRGRAEASRSARPPRRRRARRPGSRPRAPSRATLQPSCAICLAARRVFLEQPADDGERLPRACRRAAGCRPPSAAAAGSSPAVSAVRYSRRRREIAARDERLARAAPTARCRRGRGAAACAQRRRALRRPCPRPRAPPRSSGTARPRSAHSRALGVVAGGEVDVQQLLADFVVVRVQLGGLAQRLRSLRAGGPCRPARRRSP